MGGGLDATILRSELDEMEMTIHHVRSFLQCHQPMPPDSAVMPADIEELDRVRRFLTEQPNDEALELLLGVFGEGSGFGIYQLIENAVAAHDRGVVVTALARKLERGPRSVRYWCAQIAATYPDDRLIEPLSIGLAPGDHDLRWATVTALAAINAKPAKDILQRWLPQETDAELRSIIEEACIRI
jgi:hypothetical protein